VRDNIKEQTHVIEGTGREAEEQKFDLKEYWVNISNARKYKPKIKKSYQAEEKLTKHIVIEF
jgi:hypothetical protein